MIISASRRTDLPAFYAPWLMKRLREGFAWVRNPFNYHQVSRVPLNPDVVDCLVFWTKNPALMLEYLSEIESRGYPFYFQFSLTPYDRTIEVNLPAKAKLAATFKRLSDQIGPNRVVWRYDPILLTTEINLAYHFRQFEGLAKSLGDYTKRCVISFLDIYKKTTRNTKSLGIIDITPAQMGALGKYLGEIARFHGIEMVTCAESIDLSPFGIKKGACIDVSLIENIFDISLQVKKDPYQRPECNCAQSIDLGSYNTCLHNCLYCYANSNQRTIAQNRQKYDPNSPLLCGTWEEGDYLTKRQVHSFRSSN